MTKLINGDCLDHLKKFQDNSIDMCLTSPPYDNLRVYNGNISQWNFEKFKEIAKQLYRVLKPGAVCVWVVNDSTVKGSESGTSFKQALYFKEIGFNIHDTMLYRKNNPKPLNHNRYEQEFEYMFCFSKGRPKTFNPIRIPCKDAGKMRHFTVQKDNSGVLTDCGFSRVKKDKMHGNIFSYTIGSFITGKYKHPAQFPIQLVKDQLITWSNEGDLILDCFMGGGTTGEACKDLKRNFIGIELDKDYFNIAKERIGEWNT